MPRPKRPDWSPMTLTLSEGSKAFLKDQAALRGTDPGKIADEIIQEAQARLCAFGKAGAVVAHENPSTPTADVFDREQAFFTRHKDPIGAMGRRFVTKLAKERRLEGDKPWVGAAWKALSASERKRVGARLIEAALRDAGRWDRDKRIPSDQHILVERVLNLYGGEETSRDHPTLNSSDGFTL